MGSKKEPQHGEPVTTAKGGASLVHLEYRQALQVARDRATREYLVDLMTDVGGSVTRAAKRAKLERESLHRLLKRYGLRSEDFKRKR